VPNDNSVAPSAAVVVAAVSGMAAAWFAAGSVGLLSHPLRHALTWAAMAVALIATRGRPGRLGSTRNEALILLAAAALGTAMTIPAEIVINILGATLVLAVLANALGGVDRRVLRIVASATGVLALYRLALTTIPTVWLAADLAGAGLGRLAGAIGGGPLWVGASFAGLDFLVLMAAFYAGWLVQTSGARWTRAISAAAAILVGHLVYLLLLSRTSDLAALLPAVSPVPEAHLYTPPDWQAGEAFRTLLPWNLPVVAAVLHLATVTVMLRWASWKPAADATGPGTDGKRPRLAKIATRPRRATAWALLVLSGMVPVLTTAVWGTADFGGAKVVAYQQGYLDWEKPKHGEYGRASAGMYGMLPELVSSLGGQFIFSQDLAEGDLDDADILLLIHPDRPWAPEQLNCVWRFVRGGGSLLLAAEPRVRNGERRSSFDEVLEPTAMRVRFDTAISQIGQWEDSYQPLAHPATTGIGDRRNRFGMMMGSSIHLRWPARPLLVGRWGWSDPGSDAVETGSYRLDPGERLGDLVLAAEQRLGSGRVVVLGDTAPLANQTIARSYPFVGRLLGYLAGRSASPQAAWRQTLGVLACVGLTGLVLTGVETPPLAAMALLMALSLAGSQWLGHRTTRVMPDGRAASSQVAYIDATHLEAYSDESWTPDGVAGLALTLMRNGYLPLFAPDLASERLDRADVLISIAPGRKFTSRERAAVRQFVEKGGVFIATVGAEHTRPSEQLLADFQFGVPRSPIRPGESLLEPEPMGCFLERYPEIDDYKAQMIFHAGWPIRCPVDNAEVLVRGLGKLPIIGLGFLGEGKIVLIGDSGFAMNENLEHADGQPVQGRYDNADFWRWLLSYLSGQPPWIPPKPEAKSDDIPLPDKSETSYTNPKRQRGENLPTSLALRVSMVSGRERCAGGKPANDRAGEASGQEGAP
jgi:hypothetical protein